MAKQVKLGDATLSNTPPFTFAGTHLSKVVGVIDGDTVKAAFDSGTGIFWHHVRLDGIDTPELHSKNPQERVAAGKARDYLMELVGDKLVTLHVSGADKYGRLLGVIDLSGVNVNQKMIDGGYARSYSGGKREPWPSNP